jgi:2,4-dienoyl-CoA reductase (NADPH2)
MKDFYGELAKGGVGVLTVESTGVDYPLGVHHGQVQLHLEDDKYIPGYLELTKEIHKYNCPAFIQLFHSGPWHPTRWMGLQPIAASSLAKSELPFPQLDEPCGLTIGEIPEVVNKFALAAGRAQKAGFDGVEINASSAHLINSFLSRAWNRREDMYGYKDLESRSRFLVEIIQSVKKLCGQDFPINVILTGVELGTKFGTTVKEACGFARILQDAGVDAIQVRAFGYGDYTFIHPGPEQMLVPEAPESLDTVLDWSRKGAGAFVPLAEALKKVVTIPVIAVGRLDAKLGEAILRQGKADIIGLHRRLLADPELPNKIATGRVDEIAPCTGCLYCWHQRRQNKPIQCRVNAGLGREREYAIQPATVKKKVLLVGGGPAGMEAARVAALRGHEVMLCEKENKLGGLVNLAAIVKELKIEDLIALVRYLKTKIVSLKVNMKLGKAFNAVAINDFKPDVIILANGGIPTALNIPGINRRNVQQGASLHRQLKFFIKIFGPRLLQRLTRLWMPMGKNIAIIGGSIQGCELAEFLVKRGRKVTIIEAGPAIGEGVFPDETREAVVKWLIKKGSTLIPGALCKEITANGVVIVNKNGDLMKIIKADTIVTALPLSPNTGLFKSLEGKASEIYAIGDCKEPRLMVDAIADGSRIGRAI